MTKKSEDQMWVCTNPECPTYAGQISNPDDPTYCICEAKFIPYFPYSKYLALQKNLEGAEYIIDVEHRRNNKLESDLAVAVEALRRIAEPSSEDIVIPIRKIAKEALGKIGNK